MAALDNASQIKISLIDDGQGLMAAPDDVAQVKVSLVGDGEQSIALVQSRGDGVALNGSAQPALALAVPGIQGPSGTAFEEIPLNKLAPGTLPSGVSLGNALTFDDEGGASPGGTFNGGSPRTISYTSVGAAAAGHTHANLIFVPAGANDTALAAAFTDAAANGKRIVFAENTTVRIPSVAPTIQAACTLVMPTVDVTVLIESGHTINNVNVLRNGDFSRFRLASEDAEVLVDPAWSAPAFTPPQLPEQLRGVVECYNAVAPTWDFILDCNAKADHGLVLFYSKGHINALKGFRRSRVANIMAHEGSNLSGGRANISNTLKGIVCTDGLQRGVWITYASSAACPYADLRNNGTDTGESNHVAIFVSRGSHVQFDNCDCSGSTRGLRTARSLVSARGAKWDNIDGLVINAFDGNQVTVSAGSFKDCGAASPNWLMAISSSTVVANTCNFDRAAGVIANLQGPDATLSLSDCTGADLTHRIAIAIAGDVFCNNCTFSASFANWDPTELEFFTGSAGGRVHVFGGSYNGAAVVRRLGRLVADAEGSFDRTTSTNFIEDSVALVEDGAQVYTAGTSHNGSTNALQRGINANGEFVRHANGTQECWAWLEVTQIVTSKLMTRQWSFPAAFAIGANTVTVTAALSKRNSANETIASTQNKLRDCQVIPTAHSTSLCNFDIEINSAASTTFVTGDTLWIRAHVIGRWF
jgi:hypothetical protein